MPEIAIKDINPNPYRDIETFELNPAKVRDLVISMVDTEFWDNILVRKDPDNEGKYQLAYGHHRLEALRVLASESIDDSGNTVPAQRPDLAVIDIPVKEIADDKMLRIMANENKEGWGATVLVMLETCKQVRDRIMDEVTTSKSYEAYDKAGYKGIPSKKVFQKIVKEGIDAIGGGIIAGFLGDSWSATQVEITIKAVKALDAGYYSQDDIANMSNFTVVNEFVRLAKLIYTGEEEVKGEDPRPSLSHTWPMYLRTRHISTLAHTIVDKECTANYLKTVNTKARVQPGNESGAKHFADPVYYIAKKKIKELDVVEYVRNLVYQYPEDATDEDYNPYEGAEMTLAEIREDEEFANINVEQLIANVEDSIKRAESMREYMIAKKKEGVEEDELKKLDEKFDINDKTPFVDPDTVVEEGEDPEAPSAEDRNKAQELIDAGNTEMGAGADTTINTFPTEFESNDEDTPEDSVIKYKTQANAMIGHFNKLAAMDVDDSDTEYVEMTEALLIGALAQATKALGAKKVAALFKANASK